VSVCDVVTVQVTEFSVAVTLTSDYSSTSAVVFGHLMIILDVIIFDNLGPASFSDVMFILRSQLFYLSVTSFFYDSNCNLSVASCSDDL